MRISKKDFNFRNHLESLIFHAFTYYGKSMLTAFEISESFHLAGERLTAGQIRMLASNMPELEMVPFHGYKKKI